MSLVSFEAVTLELGGRTILSEVGFAIEPGEFVGLLGPNGAGKTTLMRAILGLVRPRRGRILVDGREAARGSLAVGYMPQVRGTSDLRWTGWDFVAGAAGGANCLATCAACDAPASSILASPKMTYESDAGDFITSGFWITKSTFLERRMVTRTTPGTGFIPSLSMALRDFFSARDCLPPRPDSVCC